MAGEFCRCAPSKAFVRQFGVPYTNEQRAIEFAFSQTVQSRFPTEENYASERGNCGRITLPAL